MQSKTGEIYEGKVTGLTNFGAFVKLSNGETGMVHISEVAPVFVKDIHQFLSEGQEVRVKVLTVGENNKISLSIKQADAQKKETSAPARPAPRPQPSAAPRIQPRNGGTMSFEEMMAKFKADSEDKMSALIRTTDMGRITRKGNKQS